MPRPSLTLRILVRAREHGLAASLSIAADLGCAERTVQRRLASGSVSGDAVLESAVRLMDTRERGELVRLFAEEIGADVCVLPGDAADNVVALAAYMPTRRAA